MVELSVMADCGEEVEHFTVIGGRITPAVRRQHGQVQRAGNATNWTRTVVLSKVTVPDESSPSTRVDFRCVFAAHCSGDGLHDTRRAYDSYGDGVLQTDGNRVRKHEYASFS